MSTSILGVDVTERGTASEPPVLLVHGSGMTHRAWDPVAPLIDDRRRVLLVDLPGHGASEIPPEHVEPTPPGYAQILCGVLDRLGIDQLDVAGNSVGGWTALELAKLGRARSVLALAPAGMWLRNPVTARVQLRAGHHLGRLLDPVAPALLRTRLGRVAMLGGGFAHPLRVPPEDATVIVRSLATCPDFGRHFARTGRERFRGGRDLAVPVTVVWGERDRVLPPRARRREELPATTRFITAPECGHVMMWDAPERIAELILGAQ